MLPEKFMITSYSNIKYKYKIVKEEQLHFALFLLILIVPILLHLWSSWRSLID